MQTVCHDFDKRLSRGNWARRDSRQRSSQRSARGSNPLGILMIQTLSMIMVRVRFDG